MVARTLQVRTRKEGRQKMSEISTRTAGVDVGKEHLWAAVWPDGEPLRFDNDAAGWQALRAHLAGAGVRRVGLEASGGYERDPRDMLCQSGFELVLYQPGQVRFFARAKLRRAKNDRIDARIIAQFTAEMGGRPIVVDPLRDRLAEHLTYYEQLADDLARLRTRRDGFRDAALKADLERRIADLAALKRRCLAELRRTAKASADIAHRLALLQSVPGIGFLNALVLAVRMPELGGLSRQQAAALLGVAPFHDSSGRHDGARHIAGGRRKPRNLFYMAGLAAVRSDPQFRAFYKALTARGKHHKVALVAAMRKLLAAANLVLKQNRPWIPIRA